MIYVPNASTPVSPVTTTSAINAYPSTSCLLINVSKSVQMDNTVTLRMSVKIVRMVVKSVTQVKDARNAKKDTTWIT